MKEWSASLVYYRMERAKESMEDARILANVEHWNSCVNRLYYACFYGVSALLARDGHSSSKHTGVRALFNKHCVKTGIIPKDLARAYNDLFEKRQEADYIDFVLFQKSEVLPLISKAEKLIKYIENLIGEESLSV